MTPLLRKDLPDLGGRATQEKIQSTAARPFISWPLCHAAGFLFCLFNICFYNAAPIIPTCDTVGDGELAIASVSRSGADALYITPGVIEELSILPGGFPAVAKCKFVMSGGGRDSNLPAQIKHLLTTIQVFQIMRLPHYSLKLQPYSGHTGRRSRHHLSPCISLRQRTGIIFLYLPSTTTFSGDRREATMSLLSSDRSSSHICWAFFTISPL